jgi:2-dehydropantoate 2-reductase
MKVCIVGAGAIGGLLAGAFANAGHAVSLIARGAHLEALRRDGLTVRWVGGSERNYALAATDRPESLEPQDVVAIALKAYAIGPMLPRLRSLVHADTAIVPAINGIPWWYFARHGGPHEGQRIDCLDADGAMLAAFDPKHLVGAVVHTAAEVVAPGVVLHTSGAMHLLGELDGSITPRLRRICEAIEAGGLKAQPSTAIRNEIWMKLIGNLSYNPIAALTLARMDRINANPAMIRMIRTIMTEAMAVAAAYGQPISMSIDQRIELARSLGASKVSMHQDVEKGRPMEVDAISGVTVELAQKAGVPIPTIDTLHALLSARAQHH